MNRNIICCLIITYNPNEDFFNLINEIKNQVREIIVVDNNSEKILKERLISFCSNSMTNLILNSENYGIAKALNQGIELAKAKKYEWVLIFDQDSKPFSNAVDILSSVYALSELRAWSYGHNKQTFWVWRCLRYRERECMGAERGI